jgi:solute carrier family 25 folate transporter 32
MSTATDTLIVQRSQHPTTSLTVLRSLLAQPQPLHTLYRGLVPNLVGNSISWSLFFFSKSALESKVAAFRLSTSDLTGVSLSRNARSALTPLDYFLCSGLAGLMTSIATNPIWVLKTRFLSTDRGVEGAYTGLWHGARSLYRDEGWRGFYRGLGIGMLGVTHGAVQFGVYEPLKRWWMVYIKGLETHPHDMLEREERKAEIKRVVQEAKISNSATLLISSTAKIVAGVSTYPYQVVRSRRQTYNADEKYGRGIRGVVAKVWRDEGWRGFYRGLGPNVLRVLPATWVTFLMYENVRWVLGGWEGKV